MEELHLLYRVRFEKVPKDAQIIFTHFPGRLKIFIYLFLRGRGVRTALFKLATTYHEIVKFNFNSHGQCQSLVEREARPWHQDVLAWVSQHCQGKFYSLAAATC